MPDSLFPDLDAEILLNALLAEIQDVGLVTWSAEGRITSLSESCVRLMQLPSAASVGGPVSILWESPCRDFMTSFDRFQENISETRFEQALCLMRDGAPYWIDLTVRRCPAACGKTSAYMMVVRDITQKRNALTYAEKAQDLFDAVFRGIPDAAIFVDPERQILKVSMGVEAVFGYKQTELVGSGIKMLYAKDEDYDLQGRLRYNPAKAPDYTTYVTEYRRKDGQPFSAATVGGPLHDRHGELLGYIEVLRDITDQMCLESDLREQSEMLNSIFRQLPFALGVSDKHRNIVQMSDAALDLFEYQQTEMVGSSTRMVYPSDEAFRHAGEIIYSSRPGELVIVDLIAKSGREFKGRIQVSPLYDNERQLTGYLTAIEDVTDQLDDFEKLRQYEQMVSASSDALVLLDKDHRYLVANDAYLSLWKKSRHELIGKHISQNVGEGFYDSISAPSFQRCLDGEVVRFGATLVNYPGKSIYAEARHDPYRDEHGAISGVLLTVKDVTESHLAEQALRYSQQRLNEAAKFAAFALWEIDVDGANIVEDIVLRRLLGYDQTDDLGTFQKWMGIIPEPDRSRTIEIFEELFSGSYPFAEWKHAVYTKNGELIYLEVSAKLVEKAGKQRVMGISRDVTAAVVEQDRLRLYKEIVSNSGDPLIYISRDGVFRAVNQAYCDLWDKQSNEIEGHRVEEIVGAAFYTEKVKPIFERCTAGEFVSSEIEVFHLPVGYRFIEATWSPFRDKQREIQGVVVSLRDATEIRNATVALKESEEKFRAIFDNTPIGIGILDFQDASIIDINQAALKIYGYTQDEIKRLTPWDIIDGITQDNFLSNWERVRNTEGVTFESLHRRKDGSMINVLVSAKTVELKGQEVLIGTVTDITRQKRLESLVRSQEAQYRTLVESTSAILFSADPESFKFTFVSKEAESILGYPLSDWLDDPDFWVSHIHPDDRDWAPEYCVESTRDQQDHSFNYRMIAADGREVWLHDTTSVIVEEGRVVNLVGVMVDITEQMETAQAQQRLSKMIEQSTDAILLTDQAFHITYINAAFQQLYGYALKDLEGKKPDLLNGEPNAEEMHPQIYGALMEGKQVFREMLNRKKDGSLFVCQHRISPLKGDHGEIIAYMSSQRDVSHLVQAQEDLMASEERWQYALEGAGEGVWDWDIQSGKVFYSKRWKEMLGYKEDEISGVFDEWESRVHPDDLAECYEELQSHFRGDKDIYLVETRLRRKDGDYMWILARGQAREWSEDGKPLRMIGTHQDISGRKDAEAALKKSEEQYRQIVETALEGVWVIDAGGITTFVNASMARMLEFSEAEIIGKSLFDFMDEEGRRMAEEKLENRRSGKGEVHEFRFRRRDGSDLWTYVSAAPRRDEQGNYTGAIAMISDNTEARKFQEALIISQKMEAVGQLTGGVAHDFNNILGSILGFTELAQERFGREDEKLQNYLYQIEIAGGRARDLIRQLLIFSRGENIKSAVPVPLVPLIKEIVKMLIPMLPATVEIHTELPRQSPSVKVDPLHIQQMLMNLCINARDAIDGPGVVRISVSTRMQTQASCDICGETATGDWVSIRVEDTGQGIPEGLKEDIFQPFVTSKEVGEGSGMGLAVVSGIIRSYAGHMLVSSAPGEGACFEILLPPAEVSLRKTTEYLTALDSGVNLTGKIILVVDDEPQIQAYFEALLSDYKAEVVCCDNGFQALGRLTKAAERFDLVICDQSMPGMSGSEMVRQLRNLGNEVPVILCSGYGDALEDNLIGSLNIGMLLHKPMKKSETLSAIQWLLQQKA
ncbi:MAG: PAS domain S-box protein [Candidatus Thiodiazotropha sp. (ex Monitilora ramsayi)]|nr:PAS domain S-box protein [Candidatus Thiodiazotropha sp. (ex Monitilora ramsayi)]